MTEEVAKGDKLRIELDSRGSKDAVIDLLESTITTMKTAKDSKFRIVLIIRELATPRRKEKPKL